jgi:tetratricopeptide (TPR) repeat protein
MQAQESPQELLKQAVTEQQAGKLDEAIRDYRMLLDMYPDVPQVRSNLGAALAGEGKYADAIVEYNRALKVQPNPQTRLNLALAYYKTNQIHAAVGILKRVREEDPANLQAITLLADCYFRLGQNKEVIDLLGGMQKAAPDNLAIAYLLGTALVRDGHVAEGQLMIDRILKNGDSAEARLLIGTAKYVARDYSGALADLQKAADLNPNLPDLNAYLGMALMVTGDQHAARQAFERELKIDANNFEANLRMGVLLRQDDSYEDAMRYFRHALDVRPGDLGVRYQIAAIELAQGDIDQARRDLESITKESPEFTEAHVSLATVYYREKRKADGDRERATVAQLNAARQANEPAARVQP